MTLLMIEDEKFAEGRNVGQKEGRIEGEQNAQCLIYESLVASGYHHRRLP